MLVIVLYLLLQYLFMKSFEICFALIAPCYLTQSICTSNYVFHTVYFIYISDHCCTLCSVVGLVNVSFYCGAVSFRTTVRSERSSVTSIGFSFRRITVFTRSIDSVLRIYLDPSGHYYPVLQKPITFPPGFTSTSYTNKHAQVDVQVIRLFGPPCQQPLKESVKWQKLRCIPWASIFDEQSYHILAASMLCSF